MYKSGTIRPNFYRSYFSKGIYFLLNKINIYKLTLFINKADFRFCITTICGTVIINSILIIIFS